MMEVARFTGRWVGRLRRQFNEVKEDIDRELQLEEMRRKLAEEERALRENLDANIPSIDPMQELKRTITEEASPAPAKAADSHPKDGQS
jgi:sec-independent protein translocase protein TatB